MQNMPQKTIAVIGAGPKAMALAAKNQVLRELGFQTPKIIVFEKNAIGSHWDGKHGFTNGRQPLGTSPEKDVGYPYFSYCWGEGYNARINAEMMKFSWASYLVSVNLFSEWIDRGKPAPDHWRWAAYLNWVQKKCHDLTVVTEEVTALVADGQAWKIRSSRADYRADGVVVTGPGKLLRPENMVTDDRIFTLESFWQRPEAIQRLPEDAHVAVVGSGETAASAVLHLCRIKPNIKVDLVIPFAMSYSRGESYVENHVYTDPFQSNWYSWTKEDRLNFIQRTDRGVFSLYAKSLLDQMSNVEIIPGWFRNVRVDDAQQLGVEIEYNHEKEVRVYDSLVLSLGFDPWGQVMTWLDEPSRERLKKELGVSELRGSVLEDFISEDLSLMDLQPRLHLPMLAALMQGPGIPNLSCLGRVADQILQSYVTLR